MVNMKRTQAILLSAALACTLLASCGEDTAKKSTDTNADTAPTTEATTETAAEDNVIRYQDDLGDLDFGGAEFRIRTIENLNVHSYVDVQEETADVYDDALYKRNRAVEERLNIVIKETLMPDDDAFRKTITAGDDSCEMGNVRCDTAMNYWADELTYSITDIPHINLEKPYWAKKLNDSITLGENQYVAIGAYDVNVLDLTYALLFNKQLVSDFDFISPYTLVAEGKWTMDQMKFMMLQVVSDLNGDGTYTEDDRWGYLSHYKQVLPDFWIAAGEMSILKDQDDRPAINMTSDRFVSVFNKTFDIIWDTNVWYSKCDPSLDVPKDNVTIFSEGRALFMDVSFFHIENLRNAETEFGILPYPKYDEAQEEYYSRVSYYWANVVPVTNTKNLDMTGAVIEAMNCESANTVVPAYYDVALKTKYSRDEESAAMLDLIFENRVVDLGDTLFCGDIRDGFMASMFQKNSRDLASQVAKKEKLITKKIDKLPIWD